MALSLKKLNPLGIAHYLIPVAVFVLVGVGGGAYLIKSHAATPADTLATGQALHVGQQLVASSNGLTLRMQGDGNVTLYSGAGLAIWSNNKYGTGTNNRLVMQPDGNLVEYTAGNAFVWSNGKSGSGANNHLTMQGDGNLVEYTASGGVVWATGTYAVNFESVGSSIGPNSTDPGQWVYNSAGISHGSGVACPVGKYQVWDVAVDWCSNSRSGSNGGYMWYGPYANQPDPNYNFGAGLEYYWTNSRGVPINPPSSDAFTFDVTDTNGGTYVLASERVSGCNNPLGSPPACYAYLLINNEPIKNLEIRGYSVYAGNSGDILNIAVTILDSQSNIKSI